MVEGLDREREGMMVVRGKGRVARTFGGKEE
jgi:hypothetical protein